MISGKRQRHLQAKLMVIQICKGLNLFKQMRKHFCASNLEQCEVRAVARRRLGAKRASKFLKINFISLLEWIKKQLELKFQTAFYLKYYCFSKISSTLVSFWLILFKASKAVSIASTFALWSFAFFKLPKAKSII